MGVHVAEWIRVVASFEPTSRTPTKPRPNRGVLVFDIHSQLKTKKHFLIFVVFFFLLWFRVARHGAADGIVYWQAFPCCHAVSLFSGFGMDGDPSRGMQAGVWVRGTGLDSVGVRGPWQLGRRAGTRASARVVVRHRWGPGHRSALTPVTGPTVPRHSVIGKRLFRAQLCPSRMFCRGRVMQVHGT